jgi:hypothetical protein
MTRSILCTLLIIIISCGNALHVNDLVDYVSASGELAGKSAAHFAAHTRDEIALTISDDFGYLVPQRLDRTEDNSSVVPLPEH